jgi:pyruvate dehydrogenase E2 component (dihydrolipoamide acetyltransferase)
VAPAASGPIEVRVPDIGDFKDVAVIELLVKVGDTVKAEQSLFTVESDKASMEIPSPAAGVLKELKVKLGDKVNQGDLVAIIEGAAAAPPRQRPRHRPRAGCGSAAPAARPRRPGARGAWRRRPTTPPWPPAPAAARQPLGAQVRPRAGRAAGRGQGQRPQGPHHPGRRAGLHQGR